MLAGELCFCLLTLFSSSFPLPPQLSSSPHFSFSHAHLSILKNVPPSRRGILRLEGNHAISGGSVVSGFIFRTGSEMFWERCLSGLPIFQCGILRLSILGFVVCVYSVTLERGSGQCRFRPAGASTTIRVPILPYLSFLLYRQILLH